MDVLEWLSATAPAMALRRSATLYMVVNAAHILSIGLLVGAILPLDLRLAGFFRKVPVEVVAPFLSRSAGVGLVLAIATGFCLFSVRAVEYAENPAFLAKLGLIGLGLLNLLAVHVGRGWKTLTATGRVRPGLRFSAALSAVFWIAAVLAGRWIGFL
ncbi:MULTISPECIES: DUF6644 family protein [Rhizobium]|uniref:DUF2214 domain-containing protein n=1 Tax=Rhizobium bangladeshense TaxID=1138189 RepID=A0ABS7LMJ2_9HYPH|nr:MULTISPECIES: DUF6644 family protein [Rhizobium]MBX4869355.1 DUF2214 domain-containing protein [Rhizobium bangladeshense]MBX4874749.1 DUF2214 domain-containing protein [Rhizobium bangladeshense]MBX4885210.1 DUF2214 domain-containing protein [Rhizobium bangladeshense]MBX4892025.1 DUF2214 domain-containing protein [Rhizobium bangladeshense]MBX4897107.1 DUF2214 domain-containing protein [Rhizobium bangladeshense]